MEFEPREGKRGGGGGRRQNEEKVGKECRRKRWRKDKTGRDERKEMRAEKRQKRERSSKRSVVQWLSCVI